MSTVLIDADIVVYQVSAAGEEAVNFDTDTVVAWADLDQLTHVAVNMVTDIQRETNCNDAILCFSDNENFRKKILETYKGNRSGSRKPIAYSGLKKKLSSCFDSYQKPSLEGDDLLGILATHPTIVSGKKIIYSQDKDLKQIPGRHFNIKEKAIEEVTEEQGDRFHYLQTLSGDRTDNYFGCPGIGPKRAETLLDKSDDPWSAIVGAYEKAGLTEQDALVQAQVAKICRHTEYNFETRKPILWKPITSSIQHKEAQITAT
tara:strand:+ start:4149 stop:4928 length:780 start_codon:yes stop_codon:yes gene_type:complete